jgi:hypothetical protein
MRQFYIGGDGDIHQCRKSLQTRALITLTGLTEDRGTEIFTGIVQSLEYLRLNPPKMCWRITIRDPLLQGEVHEQNKTLPL